MCNDCNYLVARILFTEAKNTHKEYYGAVLEPGIVFSWYSADEQEMAMRHILYKMSGCNYEFILHIIYFKYYAVVIELNSFFLVALACASHWILFLLKLHQHA